MLVVISPAKRLDFARAPAGPMTAPAFAAEAAALARIARRLPAAGLRGLMRISDALARLNAARFRDFAPGPLPAGARPAVFAIAGDTYRGLEARTLDEDALAYAQRRLRILSGLYGLLRPLDAIQPHRLEMGSRLATPRGATLLDWWGDRPAEALNAAAEAAGTRVLVNCASREYFAAVDRAALRLKVVTPVFLEARDGRARIVSLHAKRARGAMARFILERRIDSPEALRDFDAGGYAFRPELSGEGRLVFLRGEAEALREAG